ncbi:Cyclin dependent kinase C [Rhynchospora pubera]|uniref:[RNA-polymerase]-subunit kinase n=1 Tax=Rhynchospora pubera TaxID=906938 RepID=A0AAV8DFN2_9POAL|nr:Cyclin dependent kinase C [Rhynchospora pubera]
MWSVGCIFAELLHGKPILPGQNDPEQLSEIFKLCGTPDESNWPGVTKIPWYNNFKPPRPMKRRLKEVFKHFDHNALDLLKKMLTLDPENRISAKDALDAEYFWTEPLPCDPKSLPKYESSHEFQTKKKRQQQRQQEEAAKRQKLSHPLPHTQFPPIQQPSQPHPHVRPGMKPPMHRSQLPMAGGPIIILIEEAKGAVMAVAQILLKAVRGAPPPYGGSGMSDAGAPRGTSSDAGGYGGSGPSYPQGGPYGAAGPGRGPNNMRNQRQQQYGGWQ